MKKIDKKGQIIIVTEVSQSTKEDLAIFYEVVQDGDWHGNKNINPINISEQMFEFEGVILKRLTKLKDGLGDVPRRRRATIKAFRKYKFNY